MVMLRNGLIFFAVVIVLVFILVFWLAECDRRFSCTATFKEQYTIYPARALLGALNTVIRMTHPCPAQPDMETHFPQHSEFWEHREEIRKEAINILQNYKVPSFAQVDKAFEDISSEKWKTFVIRWYGDLLKNAQLAPVTSRLVAKHEAKIGCAMFSVLEPNTLIPLHKGPNAAALRYHLCLQVPKDGTAKIRVDNEWITYENDKEYLFDDTYKHMVKVDAPETDNVRIVLFMDVYRELRQPLRWIVGKIAQNAKFADFVKNVNANGEVQQKIRA